MKEMVSLVEANEPGCLRYNVFYNEDENTFHVAEQYLPHLLHTSIPSFEERRKGHVAD